MILIMDKCIYDEFDECCRSCENCLRSEVYCSECGCKYGSFYESCGRTLCFECFKEEIESEELAEFAAEYESEFDDFLIRKHEKERVRSCSSKF